MKTTLQTLIKNRSFLTPFVVGVLLIVVLLFMGILYIRPSDLQVQVRYTSFGIANFYGEQWFYQFIFLLYGVGVFILGTLISLKLYTKKDIRFSIAHQWLTVVLLIVTLLIVGAIFRVSSLA